jgi:hypothetical protein
MAKDKGKAAKAEPKSKGKADKSGKSKGGGGAFAKPSEAPNTGGDGFKLEHEDNVGKLFLITPLRTDSVKTEDYGETEVIVCDVVELNEKKPAKSELHENVFVFGGWVKGALRGYIGERKVLSRLGQDASKTKSKAKGAFAWVLEDGDDDDIAIATEYIDQVDPFKASSADKAKAKSGKKGK